MLVNKVTKISFKSKNVISIFRPLQLLHIDLFGPSRTLSLGGKPYCLVCVDDYSRFTKVIFLVHKSDTCYAFSALCKRIQNMINLAICGIRSDYGREFDNDDFILFCDEHDIDHNFSAPRTLQQNGVVERKNRVLEEMARTMLCENGLPRYFWVEAVNTTCYVVNRAMIKPILKKTPYELLKGRKPNISHLRAFGFKCFVLNNNKDNLGKFDVKSNEAVFLSYSNSSKAYRVFNKRILLVKESVHIAFDESNSTVSKNVESEDVA